MRTILLISFPNEKTEKLLNLIDEDYPDYEIRRVGNIEEALKRVFRNSFDLAVVDSKMGNNIIPYESIIRECCLMGKPVIVFNQDNTKERKEIIKENSDVTNNIHFIGNGEFSEKLYLIGELVDKKISPYQIFGESFQKLFIS